MKQDTIPNAVTLLLSDARGVYIPRDFICDAYNEIAVDHCKAWGLTEENADHWEDAQNPENDWYCEAWDWILHNARYIDKQGNAYHLHHDGDLWALCYDKMTDKEKMNFGFDIE
jgi:hypothetical protein